MILWAVKVLANAGTVATIFAVPDESSAVVSAKRINNWVTDMGERHPDDKPDVQASAVIWEWDPDDHAEQVAQYREAEENEVEDK